MAEYTINFSTNASKAVKQLEILQREISSVITKGRKITLNIDTSQLASGISTTFNKLDREIAKVERRLNKLQIGSPAFRSTAASLGFREGQAERGRLIAEPLRLRGQAQAFEEGSLVRLRKEIEALQIEASQVSPNSVEWIKFQQQIAQVSLEMQKAGKLADSIQLQENLGAFAPGSLAQLETKLQLLRNRAREITPQTDEWVKLNREIQRLEGGIEKLSRKPFSARERLGAAGGAFLYGGGLGGGVGSALGGVAGGLLGGVSGAFTGAALGQFTDNVGNALAATAKFTAEIDKQRIALRNVIGDTELYNQALQFIDKTSKELAIPQEILNKSFTQISASVIGAGGSVRDAEEAFLGIAAGIRGTGGSLTDTEGALRATAQVFSKGKVSAEELRQQIGERLPGAFALFAQSIGKTPQELDKMLEQGQVGLNDFMVFVRQLSATYGSTAQEIAASTQAAGDRMAVAMSTMREAVGRELQPVGAEFQAIFADFIQNQSPNFKAAANALAESLKPLAAALKAVSDNAEALAGGMAAFAAALAVANLPAAIAAIAAAVKGLTAAALANPFVAIAAGIGIVTAAAINGQQELNRYNDLISGSVGSQEDLEVAIKQVAAELKQAEASMEGNGRMADFASSRVDTLRNRLLALEGRYKAVIEIEQIFTGQKGVPSGYRKIDGRLAYEVPGQGFVDAETGKVVKGQTSGFKPASPAGGGGGKARKGGKGRESRLPELTEELNLAKQLFALDQQLIQAQLADNQLAVLRLNGAKEQLRIASEIAKIKLQKDIPAAEQAKQIEILRLQAETKRLETSAALEQKIGQELKTIEQAMTDIALTAAAELEDRKSYERLVAEGLAPALAQITVEVQRQFATQVAQLEGLKKRIETEISLLETERDSTANAEKRLKIEQDIAKARGRLGSVRGAIEGAPALAQATIESTTQKQLLENKPKTAVGFLTEASDNAQKELAKLTNWGFQAVEGARAISSAFGQAFKDIASGSVSAQEALANMMQSIADHFLDMAAQIIAQQITMMIYGIILKALGVMGGAAQPANTGGFAGMTVPNNALGEAMTFQMMGFAKGGIAPKGFQAFANGGMVTGPTLGLVGEGKYNEAIVPLPDGRSIPVQLQDSSIRDKMGGDMASAGAMPMLSMSFQTTTINGVEYVDRAQLEAAMAETRRISVREGATRGATIALDKLANSPSSRRRVGLR